MIVRDIIVNAKTGQYSEVEVEREIIPIEEETSENVPIPLSQVVEELVVKVEVLESKMMDVESVEQVNACNTK